MKIKYVDIYLIASILTMSVIPLASSYVLIEDVVDSSFDLLGSENMGEMLEDYRLDLKRLGLLEPENLQDYRAKFDMVGNTLLNQRDKALLKDVLKDTYTTYYILLFAAIMFVSVCMAILLSKKVSNIYRGLAEQDVKKSEKIQELVYFDEWQTIAGKLAHELKNPLIPIEIMANNLLVTYRETDSAEFSEYLEKTHSSIKAEVKKLREMIMHFARFSKIPKPNFKKCRVVDYIAGFVSKHKGLWENVSLEILEEQGISDIFCLIDPHLFDQSLYNIYNNAAEANPGGHLRITTSISKVEDDQVSITIKDDGKGISDDIREDIFKMYYSTKPHGENMGLGLPIARKIVLDHSGSIACKRGGKGAEFEIRLPVVG